MELDDCFEIGYILKPHGLKGAVNIHLDVDEPSKYAKMESVLVKMGDQLVPFFITYLALRGSKGIMELEDISSQQQATQLNSCTLMLPLKLLPSLDEHQFYYHDVIGYTIIDSIKGKLGIIESILTGGNQDLIVMRYKGKEVMIPVNDELVGKADHSRREVYTNLPEGLLEIYL